MTASSFGELSFHVGHKIVCSKYGELNVAIECLTCNEVLFEFDRSDDKRKR